MEPIDLKNYFGDEIPSIFVIDNGSYSLKAGFAGETIPRFEMPNIIGKMNHKGLKSKKQKNIIGNECYSLSSFIELTETFENGKIKNWENMEKIWNHILFDELKIVTEESLGLITESPLTPKANREKVVQIIFETYNLRGFYYLITAQACLYSIKKPTAFIIEIGKSCYLTPVYDTYCLPHATQILNIGGDDLTKYLGNLIFQNQYSSFQSKISFEYQLLQKIKEEFCYVALDLNEETKNFEKNPENFEKTLEISNDKNFKIGKERFLVPEILFNPSIINRNSPGISSLILKSIERCDIDIRDDFYHNIILAGGSSLFPFLENRIEKEIRCFFPDAQVFALENRENLVWKGASMYARSQTFFDKCYTWEEYQESGPSMIHVKVF
ncbi:actin cytoskeletal 2a [Anaeramoeba ignava]|uniref:Actin cytoskeletal 2a n=1 Tax=Anaeramoeba ignava TaxID=1746090 RepID=A0A9Q0L8F1_ANAIG|nr:actin cytoskeletal 2a [Anaeramoeba ignava]